MSQYASGNVHRRRSEANDGSDGDLLEARTVTKLLFIDGRPVPLDTKHAVLFQQFKDRK